MTMTTATQNTVANEIEESHQSMLIEADELLREITVERREPTEPELAWFVQHFGWDKFKVSRQRARMSVVVRNQAIAGSPADRKAVKKEAETSAKLFNDEVPRLDAQIEKLQDQRFRLERDRDKSAKRMEEQTKAMGELRKQCPLHVAKPVGEELARVRKEHFIDGVSKAESRIANLKSCLNPPGHLTEYEKNERLQRVYPDLVMRSSDGHMATLKMTIPWAAVQLKIEAELSELNAKLPEMQAEYDAAIAKAEEPLDYYADPKIQQRY